MPTDTQRGEPPSHETSTVPRKLLRRFGEEQRVVARGGKQTDWRPRFVSHLLPPALPHPSFTGRKTRQLTRTPFVCCHHTGIEEEEDCRLPENSSEDRPLQHPPLPPQSERLIRRICQQIQSRPAVSDLRGIKEEESGEKCVFCKGTKTDTKRRRK